MMVSTYVFEDTNTLAKICGGNDSNLAYLEKLLSCEISVRGNRIECGYNDEKCGSIFIKLMERLEKLTSITDDISEPEILMEYKVLETCDERPARHHITVGTKAVFPKSIKQEEYIKEMEKNQIVFAVGPAGTGKTFLAINYCLGELFAGRKQKIVLTRPVVEAGESLGFLPGDLSQKLNPYLKPLYDSMEATVSPQTVKRLEETGQIEIAPLAYMRGRSINNACIILDEAQNTTKAQMKMFLTRLGENSCAIITGDTTQIDLPKVESSGLLEAEKRLSNVEGISFIFFSGKDTVRSRIVQRIVELWKD